MLKDTRKRFNADFSYIYFCSSLMCGQLIELTGCLGRQLAVHGGCHVALLAEVGRRRVEGAHWDTRCRDGRDGEHKSTMEKRAMLNSDDFNSEEVSIKLIAKEELHCNFLLMSVIDFKPNINFIYASDCYLPIVFLIFLHLFMNNSYEISIFV